MMRRLMSRTTLAAALVVVMVLGVIVAVRATGQGARTMVVGYFDNSTGVFAGDDVRTAPRRVHGEATKLGVTVAPCALRTTDTCSPSNTAAAEFVVPKSIPTKSGLSAMSWAV